LLEDVASAGVEFLSVPARKKPEGERRFKVGERIAVTLQADPKRIRNHSVFGLDTKKITHK